MKPTLILFDVYETLLDLGDVETKVNDLLDTKRGFRIWYEMLMEYSFADNCSGMFHGFAEVAKATLDMTAYSLGESVTDKNHDELLGLFQHAPLYDGVQEGLSYLQDHGYRVAALTNGPDKIVSARMELTGLVSYFEFVLSAEKLQLNKPAKEAYLQAAKAAELSPAQIMMASTHGWDLAGATNAGMQTAWIKRKGTMLYPLAPAPQITAKDLPDLASQLKVSFPVSIE